MFSRIEKNDNGTNKIPFPVRCLYDDTIRLKEENIVSKKIILDKNNDFKMNLVKK